MGIYIVRLLTALLYLLKFKSPCINLYCAVKNTFCTLTHNGIALYSCLDISQNSVCRLARSICNQIKERLKHSHETFSVALKQLEARHSGRLEKTEERRLRVRKLYAPKVARLALESTSLKDAILYGEYCTAEPPN